MNEQETPKPEMLKRHPLCAIWPEYDITDMASDVAERGQDEPIWLYERMVLDGWHRYRSALKAGKIPTFKEFEGTLVEAAEKVHAANNVRRHMTPEQRYACFLKLCQQVPEFAAKYEALKADAKSRIAAGQPLATGSQRLNVMAAKAADAGVSPATAKKVERAVKNDPDSLDRLAKGTSTANKELGKKAGNRRSTKEPPALEGADGAVKDRDQDSQRTRKQLVVAPGDFIYEIDAFRPLVKGSPRLIQWQVQLVDTHSFVCVGKSRLHKSDAFTLEEAKAERIKRLEDQIAELQAELRSLKSAVRTEPIIVAGAKKEQGEEQSGPSPQPPSSSASEQLLSRKEN
jgi:hypothetical protein